MSRFDIIDTPLQGLKVVQRQRIGDARGFFSRMFCAEELGALGWSTPIAQINLARTNQAGTVRGLHYQRTPHAELKMVSCLRGDVWDLALDLRAGSATFLHWYAHRLSAENLCAMLIPAGFAHGFQALSDDVELLYFHSRAYAPDAEAGVHPQDPRLAIDWPLAVNALSARDAGQSLLAPDFEGVRP